MEEGQERPEGVHTNTHSAGLTRLVVCSRRQLSVLGSSLNLKFIPEEAFCLSVNL